MTATFTERARTESASALERILAHPFVTGLGDGTLPQGTFVRYLVDDAHYLLHYARALAAVASRLDDAVEVGRWAGFAVGAVAGERELHTEVLAAAGVTPDRLTPSTACTRYTGFLLDHVRTSPVEVAVAALLPCFRVYLDVGRHLVSTASGATYADWIATYAAPEFASQVEQAESTTDRLAAAPGADHDAMLRAYLDAVELERRFWDASWTAGPLSSAPH